MFELPKEEQEQTFTKYGIPIRNLWLLYFYASDMYKHLDEESLHGCEQQPEGIPNLLAEVLCQHVEHRVLRSLTQSYHNRSRDLNRVRGKIDLLMTERRKLLSKGKVHCHFDELTVDTSRNQYVVSALSKLAILCSNKALITRCVGLKNRLLQMGVLVVAGVKYSDIGRLGRNDIQDRKMLDISRLIHDMSYMNESAGNRRSMNPNRDETHLRTLFEKAVGGFYWLHLKGTGWTVNTGKKHEWQVENGSDLFNRLLPGMETDIILESKLEGRRIIIDTKFNNLITRGQFDNESARSGYLYQLYAYLNSQEKSGDPLSINSEGVLLHPEVDRGVDESGLIQGHLMRFCTVKLNGDFSIFKKELLRIVSVESEDLIAN